MQHKEQGIFPYLHKRKKSSQNGLKCSRVPVGDVHTLGTTLHAVHSQCACYAPRALVLAFSTRYLVSGWPASLIPLMVFMCYELGKKVIERSFGGC